MPEASSPGSATRLSVIPPMPAASMIRKAPSTGEPSRVLIAAKLPAEAMMVRAIGGASFFARCTVSAARPPPMAIRGASGPSTAPRLSVVSAASTIPGSSLSTGGPPPVWNPNAGEWPPLPGRYRMVKPVSTPQSTNQGTGHQAGTPPEKMSAGRSVEHELLDLGRPAPGSRRQSQRSECRGSRRAAAPPRYGLERMTATGSMASGPAAGEAATAPRRTARADGSCGSSSSDVPP